MGNFTTTSANYFDCLILRGFIFIHRFFHSSQTILSEESVWKNNSLPIANPDHSNFAMVLFGVTPFQLTDRLFQFSLHSTPFRPFHSFSAPFMLAKIGLQKGVLYIYKLGHGSIIQGVPLSFSASTAALFLVLLVRIIIGFALNVSRRRSLRRSRSFRHGTLSLVVFLAVVYK